MSSETEPSRTVVALPGGEEFVEAYVGWREWRMVAQRGEVKLRPISVPSAMEWTPGVNEAACHCGNHAKAQRCGFHAWNTPPQAVLTLRASDFCWGEVALWGDVEVTEKGYRSSHAMITCLWSLPESPLLVSSAALAYDVPLINPGYVKIDFRTGTPLRLPDAL